MDEYDYGDPSEGIVVPFNAQERANTRAERAVEQRDDWAWIDLTDAQWDEDPEPPDLHEFLYSGLRHVISGTPGSAKTLIIYNAAIRLVRSTRRLVVVLDFEMGPKAGKLMLRELGATDNEIALIRFATPESPPRDVLAGVIAVNPILVIIDASAGAYRASGLDDNKRLDAEAFAHIWVLPLWRAGIATALLDHLTKNPEGRGGFVIGSERKIGQTDVHIGLSIDEKHPLKRGGKATATVTVHKDRRAFLRRPVAYFVDITSDPDTHQLDIGFRPPEAMAHTDKGDIRPTIKMDQISGYLAKQDDPVAQKAILSSIGGNETAATKALKLLVLEGHVSEHVGGPGKANLYTLLRPYDKTADELLQTQAPPPPPDLRPGSASGGASTPNGHTSATSANPLKGGGGAGGGLARGEVDETKGGSANHDEAEIERLLEKYDDLLS